MPRIGHRTVRAGIAAVLATTMVGGSTAIAAAQPAKPVGDALDQLGSASSAPAAGSTGEQSAPGDGVGTLLSEALGTEGGSTGTIAPSGSGNAGAGGAADAGAGEAGAGAGTGAAGSAAGAAGDAGAGTPGDADPAGTAASKRAGAGGPADGAGAYRGAEQTGAGQADSEYSTGVVPATALSTQVSGGVSASAASVGSATMWDGGSAAMSLASSGILPGSVYTNPSGSIGSGEIGLQILGFDLAVSEMTIFGFGSQALVGYFGNLATRQEEGELTEGDVATWRPIVQGSAAAGQATRDVADAHDVLLPDSFQGSIDSVIETANSPVDLRSREEREADEAAENGDYVSEDADGAGHDADAGEASDDAADAGADEASTTGAAAEATGGDGDTARDAGNGRDATVARNAQDAQNAQNATVAPDARVAAQPTADDGPQLAVTGADVGVAAAGAAVLLVLGSALVVVSRRRAN